jgi:FkbM family methyltransferase
MKKVIKNIVQVWLREIVRVLNATTYGRYAYQQLIEASVSSSTVVRHGEITMKFSTPTALCRYRADSFSSKEPDTLSWLERIPEGDVLWDVGANVGLYSIYAARRVKARVFAFEPSVFNLEFLARNIFINGLQDRVTIVPLALSDTLGPSLFKMTSTAWGGALSAFGQDFDQHGNVLNSIFEYQTMGITIDQAIGLLNIPMPRFIKIDVDGIEHFVLRGGIETLKGVKSVMIEIDDGFSEQVEVTVQHLQNAGLTLLRKCGGNGGGQYNQLWVRGSA